MKTKQSKLKVLFLIPFLFFSACTNYAIKPENKNNDFLMKIYTNKGEYKDGEEIMCYATIQYTGSTENITIYNGMPLLTFSIRNSDGYTIDAVRSLILSNTEFESGEIKRFNYEKNGGFDDRSPDWVKVFVTNNIFSLHKGSYTVMAQIQYSLDKEAKYDVLEVSKAVKVK